MPAEVVSVDYDSRDADNLYTILCKFLNSSSAKSPNDLIRARALNSNIKHIPVSGEIVFVCKAPTPYHSGASFGREYYYTSPISIQSSVHHNGLPGANKVSIDGKTKEQRISNATTGIPQKLSDSKIVKDQIDPGFPERIDVHPLQPFPGDIIFEGRWGQSIRFGSSPDTRRRFPQPPNWGIGTGATGNPVMILSNGTNPRNKKYNQFHIESPDDDDSSIWLTSGQSVSFTPAASYRPSVIDKEVDLYKKNSFGGNQVILASDRIIFNAKAQEIVGFAKQGIGFATDGSLVLNGRRVVEIESERISLGFNATSPVILGDRMIQLLSDFLNTMIDLNKSLLQLTVPTGVGPSGIPLNSGDFVGIINELQKLINQLPRTASKFAFVNEYANGPSDADRENFKQLKDNRFVVKPQGKQRGDTNRGVSFESLG